MNFNDMVKKAQQEQKKAKASLPQLTELMLEVSNEDIIQEAFEQADVKVTPARVKTLLQELHAKQEEILEALNQTLMNEMEAIISNEWGE